MRGALKRLRVYLLELSPSIRALPTLVDFETIPQLFNQLAERYAGQPKAAIGYKDKTAKTWVDVHWDNFADQVHTFAGYLHKEGIRNGDRVAILSENRPEWAITDLATQFLGAVNVSLYTTLPASQVGYILKDSGAKILVVSVGLQLRKADAVQKNCPELRHIVSMAVPRKEHTNTITWETAMSDGAQHYAAHQQEIDAMANAVMPDDLSALIYTSGTTGNPKGVMMSHQNFVSNAKAAHEVIDLFEDDIHLSFLPLCHAFERTAGYTAMLAGGAKIVYAESIDTVSKNLPEIRPTLMISVPRLFERVFNVINKSVEAGSSIKKGIFHWAVGTGKAFAEKERAGKTPGPILLTQNFLANRLVFSTLQEKLGGRIRFAVSGGAALPREIGEFFEAAGIILVEGYGLSETAPILSISPMEYPVYGTVGHVVPGTTVAIQDLKSGHIIGKMTGVDYPSGLTTGAGEIIAKGPNIMKGYWNDPNATAEVFDDDGWFHTGDVGRFEDGHLKITDRIKHMIVSKGGKNIYPAPIEEQFVTNPLIDQVMVVGEGREFLTALVVPDRESLIAQLPDKSSTDLVCSDSAQKLFADLFRTYSKTAAGHEKVRDFRLIEEPFSVENELLTPTMKLRRKAIEQMYSDRVEEMYADVM